MPRKKTKERCDDQHCPVHANIGYRGRTFVGTVTDVKAYKSAAVEWKRWHYVPKYERFESRKTRIRVHNSPCINAKKGDKVKIRETRPLSKTKTFVIVEVLGKDIEFMEREEAMEEAKVKKEKEKKKEEKEPKKKTAGKTKEKGEE